LHAKHYYESTEQLNVQLLAKAFLNQGWKHLTF